MSLVVWFVLALSSATVGVSDFVAGNAVVGLSVVGGAVVGLSVVGSAVVDLLLMMGGNVILILGGIVSIAILTLGVVGGVLGAPLEISPEPENSSFK